MAGSMMRMKWVWPTIGTGWSAYPVYNMQKVVKDMGMRNQPEACFEMSLTGI